MLWAEISGKWLCWRDEEMLQDPWWSWAGLCLELCTILLLAAGFQTCTVSAHLPTDVLRSHTNSSTPISMLVCTTSRHRQGWKATYTFKHTAPVPAKLRCGCWWKSTTSMPIWWSVAYPGFHRPVFQNVHKARLGEATWSTPGAMSSITAP